MHPIRSSLGPSTDGGVSKPYYQSCSAITTVKLNGPGTPRSAHDQRLRGATRIPPRFRPLLGPTGRTQLSSGPKDLVSFVSTSPNSLDRMSSLAVVIPTLISSEPGQL